MAHCIRLRNLRLLEKSNMLSTKSVTIAADFIRGYFDGNGSTVNAGGSIRWQLDSPSEDMANKICYFLKENSISATIEKLPKVNITIYRVYAYNKTNAKKIFDFLYKGKTIFLQRKKDRFISLMK